MARRKFIPIEGVGCRLEELLKSKNLSHRKFAQMLKVSRDSVDDWTADKTNPSLPMLVAIANFFKLPSLDCLIPEGTIRNEDANIKEFNQKFLQLSQEQKEVILKTMELLLK